MNYKQESLVLSAALLHLLQQDHLQRSVPLLQQAPLQRVLLELLQQVPESLQQVVPERLVRAPEIPKPDSTLLLFAGNVIR